MSRRLPVVLVALVVTAAGAPAHASAPPPLVRPIGESRISDRQLGAQLFAGNCSTCHGSRGEGVPAGGRNLGVDRVDGAGPSLKHAGALAADFYLSTGYMPLGHPSDQPVRNRPRFSSREIRALTGFVASLGTGPGVPQPHPERGDVAHGLELFTDHCAGCHQVVGEGGIVTGAKVPPLDQATARQIAEAVRIGPYVMPRFSRKAITDGELDDIVRYVLYAQDPTDAGGWGIGHLGPFPEGMVAWAIAIIVLAGTCVAIGSRLKGAGRPDGSGG